MRFFFVFCVCILASYCCIAQSNLKPLVVAPTGVKARPAATSQDSAENIYAIRQRFLYNVLHNPNEQENEDDNDLARFNRWFYQVEPRAYPSGNLPRPDVLIRETEAMQGNARHAAQRQTTGATAWQPVGPMKVPANFNGIGRINCIVIDPLDTNKLYIGTACGGVFTSRNGGATWTSNSDNFPSVSIADIAVNPGNTSIIYAATGDGYGYENTSYNDFWGGLYSAGIMKSTDGGSTWHTTGLSYLQTNRQIIQKLLISPVNPNILLAATRTGMFRTTDAGATWTNVDGGHIYSMAFRPLRPDTIYAINGLDLRASYNAGATWQTIAAGINPSNDRATIAVSPAAPKDIWILDADNHVRWSHNAGISFVTTNPPDPAHFYGYYDRVLSVSPADSNYILAFGSDMAVSTDAGVSWFPLNAAGDVHVDNHAVAINPLHPATIYSGNDGGISVTRDGGHSWTNLGNGLMISQIYRMSASQQNPYIMLCGVQDNGSFSYDSTNWLEQTGGDGEACAISPTNDQIQVSSSQNGYFNISYDRGASFTRIPITSAENAYWTAPVAFDPTNESTIYFGYENIWATTDAGTSFHNVSGTGLFTRGATALVVAPSNNNILYAADLSHIFRSVDKGLTWILVTGNLPAAAAAISRIAVSYTDPMRVYISMSGYVATDKVFTSGTGGTTWTAMGAGLPNLPVNCIAADSSTPGALFAGTDMGVYYTDSSQTGWSLYGTGLPNVIVNDLHVNYGNYKLRAATYGRGIWETGLVKPPPSGISAIAKVKPVSVHAYPNPTKSTWKLIFQGIAPAVYTVKVTDALGKKILLQHNNDLVNASSFMPGVYTIDINWSGGQYTLKAIKE